ncbi:hypothetical protein VII00023_19896 [Vibrio ichthyoenteri ATCC 700023]|uniref:Uncharacterized protein n=1 Tax=Vibrio ichthyoenteri ATCC 700023 TaxID=870968 RepID=F9S2Q7_9VIBR|nr:hypothetical protein VII00023_19896 [Vibrio ichthyoenteri ATCC 700023]
MCANENGEKKEWGIERRRKKEQREIKKKREKNKRP